MAKLLVDAGIVVLTAFISPYKRDRAFVRHLVKNGEFIEIYVKCPVETCEQRDVKGLYKKARRGTIKQFTGIERIPMRNPNIRRSYWKQIRGISNNAFSRPLNSWNRIG